MSHVSCLSHRMDCTLAHCSVVMGEVYSDGLPLGASEPVLFTHMPTHLPVTGWGLRVETPG